MSGRQVERLIKLVYRKVLLPLISRDYVPKVRENVNKFLDYCISELPLQGTVLDIGPQHNSYSTKLFSKKFDYVTLDINPRSGADIIADVCKMPEVLDESFDVIICTEVLEHLESIFCCY